jgi:hypothetical protein
MLTVFSQALTSISSSYVVATGGITAGYNDQHCADAAATCATLKAANGAAAGTTGWQCNDCDTDNCNVLLANEGVLTNAAGSSSVSGAVATMAILFAAHMAL